MEYQKTANLLDSAPNQPSKFRTRNWVEMNDESRRTCTSNDNKFKTTMLRSNLCDYAHAYILVNGTIKITGAGNDDAAKQKDEKDKGVTFKNCAPFIKCISRIENTDLGNANDIDIVMPMYNLIEYLLILTWSRDCVITNSTSAGKFAITETKLHVPLVTLSTQDNAKLLNWNNQLEQI